MVVQPVQICRKAHPMRHASKQTSSYVDPPGSCNRTAARKDIAVHERLPQQQQLPGIYGGSPAARKMQSGAAQYPTP